MKRVRGIQSSRARWRAATVLSALSLACASAATAQPDGDVPVPPIVIEDDSDKLGVQIPPANEEDTPPAQPDAAREQPKGFAGQVRLARELASAARIEVELDRLLSADGRFNAANNGTAGDTRLAGLAARCSVLANSAEFDQTRYVLLGCQARIISALAQLDPGEDDGKPRPNRIEQVRAVADEIRALDLVIAEPTADYWQLMADLADAGESNASIGSRQALAEQLLLGYIANYQEAPAAGGFVTDARLSLARLLDERGNQGGAAELIKAIGELDEADPRANELAYLRSRIERIGNKIVIEGVTTRLEVWRSADHAGQPVLVHIYADAVTPSVKMIKQIQQTIAARALGGFTIVSLRVGEPGANSPATPWPTLPVEIEQGGVLDKLGVDALPMLAWLDGEGRLVSIGYTTAVMQQMPKPENDETEEAGDGQAEPDPESGPDLEDADGAVEPGGEQPPVEEG